MDLAHKEQINDLEDKIMPIMKNIVKKTQNFDDCISDCRDKCNRIDELLLDKCSKYDLQKLIKKLDSMVEKETYLDFYDHQHKLNEKLISQSKFSETQLLGMQNTIDKS